MKSSAVAAWLLVPLVALSARAQDEWSFSMDDVVAAGQDVMAEIENTEFDFSALADAPSIQEWTGFWTTLEGALQGTSIEDLAWLKPYAEDALGWLDSVQGAEPYADWLRQRMDYFETADEAIRSTAPKPEPAKPPPVARRIVLPPKRPPPFEPARVARAEKKAMDRETWKKKLASRPPPRRAAELVPRVQPIFRDQGVPVSIVWLAEVESTFDPDARSPVGALGLFQLMPATAQRFGLNLRPVDERRQPEKNARAAARYLGQLYRNFESWPLALAAYNAGEGRVRRTMRERSATTFDEIAGHLPAETRLYVPKVLATIELRTSDRLDW
jgi:membrane-bound lytic murein transglycosylase D